MRTIEERRAYQRVYQREYAKRHLHTSRDRMRRLPEARKKQALYYRKWYKKNGRKRTPNQAEIVFLWVQNNPKKVKAMTELNKAIRKGLLTKPLKCVTCKKPRRVHGHHKNYNKPLKVLWLCSSCHKRMHPPKKKYSVGAKRKNLTWTTYYGKLSVSTKCKQGDETMRMKEVADTLTKELGVYLNMSRLFRYEEREIIPGPELDEGKVRTYSPTNINEIRTTVILSELGVPLRDVKEYLQRPNTSLAERLLVRVNTVDGLVKKARELLKKGEPA